MATKIAAMWKVIQDNLPRSEWIDIGQIYKVVNDNLVLQPDDMLPSAPGGTTDLRWRRNVRNVLQQRKQTSEIVWRGNGVYMLPPSTNSLVINSSVPNRGNFSKEQFEKLQIARWEIGDKGERYVVECEKNRLTKGGRSDLAGRIIRVSLVNVGAGYDIQTFDLDGKERYVEVKTSMGSRLVFEWSSNEFEVAKTQGKRYWIYCVRDIGGTPTVTEIHDPASKVGHSLDVKPNSYIVKVL